MLDRPFQILSKKVWQINCPDSSVPKVWQIDLSIRPTRQVYSKLWQIKLSVRPTREIYSKALADRTASQNYQTDSSDWTITKQIFLSSLPNRASTLQGRFHMLTRKSSKLFRQVIQIIAKGRHCRQAI
jgi:hypothetical protein